MKRFFSVAALSAICISAINAADKLAIGTDIDPEVQIRLSKELAKNIVIKNNSPEGNKSDLHLSYYFDEAGRDIPFRICLPEDWDGKTKLPMVMFLHGAGNNESSYLDQDAKLMIRLASEHRMILVSPLGANGAYGNNLRLPGGFGKDTENDAALSKVISPERLEAQKISEKDVINVIEIVLANYSVDKSKLFLTGHSMGSGGTWYIGGKYATYWKALAPMSGPFVTEKGYPWKALRKKPIFITEGTQECPSLESSRMLRKFLEDRGYEVSYREFNASHPGMVPLALPYVFDFFEKAAGLSEKSISTDTVSFMVMQDDAITTNCSRWEGWGTSLCWWANRIGYNAVLTEKAASLFFDQDKGLGLNIMRYNIGGGDDPSHNHITRTDSDIPGWLVWSEQSKEYLYNYHADKNQLNVLRASAKAAGQDAYIEIFSNSPPYFMTNSGCSTGNIKAEDNNLRDDCYSQFADYLAHVTSYINNTLGLQVKSISPMNEPNTNYWPAYNYKQEGCHFDAGEAQSRLLLETSDALKKYKLDNIILTASDETNPGKQIEEIRSLTPLARNAIKRISAHTYGVNGIRELGMLAKEENINLWMSEVDGNGVAGEDAGEMAAGLWLAEKIISDISAMEPSAWVLWQVIDTHVSKDGYKGRKDSGPLKLGQGYWGTAWADHDVSEIYLSQKYYSLGQFSRYIRPNATLIRCSTGSRQVKALAAQNRQTSELTIVCTNTSAKEKTVSINLSDMDIKRGKTRQIRTSGSITDGEHWNESNGPRIRNSVLQTTLAPNSVTTFVMDTH